MLEKINKFRNAPERTVLTLIFSECIGVGKQGNAQGVQGENGCSQCGSAGAEGENGSSQGSQGGKESSQTACGCYSGGTSGSIQCSHTLKVRLCDALAVWFGAKIVFTSLMLLLNNAVSITIFSLFKNFMAVKLAKFCFVTL